MRFCKIVEVFFGGVIAFKGCHEVEIPQWKQQEDYEQQVFSIGDSPDCIEAVRELWTTTTTTTTTSTTTTPSPAMMPAPTPQYSGPSIEERSMTAVMVRITIYNPEAVTIREEYPTTTTLAPEQCECGYNNTPTRQPPETDNIGYRWDGKEHVQYEKKPLGESSPT